MPDGAAATSRVREVAAAGGFNLLVLTKEGAPWLLFMEFEPGASTGSGTVSVYKSSRTEIPEINRTLLETLRQPLEDGMVTISRATQSLTFPCRFQLAAAMNPCPSGYWFRIKAAA